MHRKLKARAAEDGVSMSEYLKRLIERDLTRPNWASLKARMAALEPLDLPETTAEMIRHERDSR
jgi:hypothetical protein